MIFSPKGHPAFKLSVMQLSTSHFSKQKKAKILEFGYSDELSQYELMYSILERLNCFQAGSTENAGGETG